jgi:hypothetical protein
MAGCVNFSDMKLHEWRRRRREIGTDERAKGWGASFNRRLKKAPPPPLLGDRSHFAHFAHYGQSSITFEGSRAALT